MPGSGWDRGGGDVGKKDSESSKRTRVVTYLPPPMVRMRDEYPYYVDVKSISI
jgi:hypothetical protein